MRIIADVDTGIDDALALAFLAMSPAVDIAGITCVAGNAPLADVTRNTLSVLAAIGCGGPVAAGAERPLIERQRASAFHGPDGLGGIGLPRASTEVEPYHAVELMRRAVEDSPAPVTLLALGPLTNVALFVRMYPDTAARLERILFMGGAISGGNATAVAEFNVWHDPEAAEIVLSAPTSVCMYSLDAFRQATICDEQLTSPRSAGSAGRRLAAEILRHLRVPGVSEPQQSILGDAGAACYLVAPHVATTAKRPTSVVLDGSLARGQTVVDRREAPGEQEEHGAVRGASIIEVVESVDQHAIAGVFLDVLNGRTAEEVV